MEEEKTTNIKPKKKFLIYIIIVLLITIVGISYAVLTIVITGNDVQRLLAGELILDLDETQTLSLSAIVPVTDEEGKTGEAYVFSLENTGSVDTIYDIHIDELPIQDGETKLDLTKVRYELKGNGVALIVDNLQESNNVIYKGEVTKGETINFELRMWIDYDVTELGDADVFRNKIRIEAVQKIDDVTVNPPELVGDMIPVIYDEITGEWEKAHILNGTWYNYDEQKWANAVTVTETNREKLVNSPSGTVIPMDDINAMFVWIPRYSYTIGNTYGYSVENASSVNKTTPGAINIHWIDTNTIDLGKAAYTGVEAKEWYTPSAFCWGNSCDDIDTRTNVENRELAGIWVAKFESSQIITSEPRDNIQQPVIKPSIDSWNHVSIANAYNSTQQYMNGINGEEIFGLSGNNYDTHMMKNTEWGAVAYLSQSIYGKYGNPNYHDGNKEVNKNNCSEYITGISGNDVENSGTVDTCTTNTYETIKGQAASTTGNIYGVYDMSGGTHEYVMGVMENSEGSPTVAYSGFSQANLPEAKYYNSYAYGIYEKDTTRSILGDATAETVGFYGDFNFFIIGMVPWFQRGGSIEYAGIFGYDNLGGSGYSHTGFRITITP